MMQSIKMIIIAMFLVIIIVGGSLIFKKQNTADQTSTEVEAMLESSLLGNVRLGTDGGINKKELVANLVQSTINTTKQDSDVKIRYVFLDKDDKKTTTDKDIESVQFVIETYKKGTNYKDMQTRSVRKLSLNYISKRQADKKELTEQFYFGVYDEAEKEVTIYIKNIGKINSIKFLGGKNPSAITESPTDSSKRYDIDYDASTVTFILKGGSPFQTTIESGGTQFKTKEIKGYTKPYYSMDSEGYSGYLDAYPNPLYTEEQVKFIDSHYKEMYDSEGFVGKLTKNLHHSYGHYTPKQTKYVTGEHDRDYDEDGYTGKLEPYLATDFVPEGTIEKYVTNQTASAYKDAEGFVGNLDQVVSGFDSKYVTETVKYSDLFSVGYLSNLGQIAKSDGEGRYGNISQIGSPIFVPNGKKEAEYKTYESSVVSKSTSTKPTEQVTNFGEWKLIRSYEAKKISGLEAEDGSDLPDFYIQNAGTLPKDYIKAGGVLVSETAKTLDELLKSDEGSTFRKGANTREEVVKIDKWGWERIAGEYHINFGGEITKPKYVFAGTVYKYPEGFVMDKEQTVTLYRGTVTKPEEDTREYDYSGKVVKPASETQPKYLYQGIVYSKEKVSGTTADAYEYNLEITYTRFEDLTIKEQDEINSNKE